MKVSILDAFKGYGNYCQQKGREQAELYLKTVECDPKTAKEIATMFSDAGKLIDPKTGRRLALGDLMGMSNLI